MNNPDSSSEVATHSLDYESTLYIRGISELWYFETFIDQNSPIDLSHLLDSDFEAEACEAINPPKRGGSWTAQLSRTSP